MKVVHSFCQCLEHGARLALREELLPKDFVEQLAASQQVRDQEDALVTVIDLYSQLTVNVRSASPIHSAYTHAWRMHSYHTEIKAAEIND